MVGNNNPYTTENTRNQGETTVGEEMIGGWQEKFYFILNIIIIIVKNQLKM